MKHLRKINENREDIVNSSFHFLKYSSGHKGWQDKFNKGLEFLESLNLTDDQYKELGNLWQTYEDFVIEREDTKDRYNEEY
jgi:hypothetical protein